MAGFLSILAGCPRSEGLLAERSMRFSLLGSPMHVTAKVANALDRVATVPGGGQIYHLHATKHGASGHEDQGEEVSVVVSLAMGGGDAQLERVGFNNDPLTGWTAYLRIELQVGQACAGPPPIVRAGIAATALEGGTEGGVAARKRSAGLLGKCAGARALLRQCVVHGRAANVTRAQLCARAQLSARCCGTRAGRGLVGAGCCGARDVRALSG